MTPPHPEPNWQPLSQLPTIVWAITGMADEAVDMLGSLREAAPKPHVLDDATVDRVIRLYTEQQGDLWLYEEQLRRWQAGKLTAAQRVEIAGLTQRLAGLRANIAAILDLAAYLKPRTIEAVLGRSDEELALDILTGNLAPPWAVPQASPAGGGAPSPESSPAESDEYDFLDGERLTTTMRALLQVADCFVSQAPIPHLLLLAPLAPHAVPEGSAALASLLRLGWITTPTPITALLTSQSRAFLATRHSEEQIQITAVQALCTTVSTLMGARDEAMLRLVEPHLLALADAWQPRNDHYALALNLTAGTYLTAFGDAQRARPYMERASALDAVLGTSPARPTRTRRGRR
ncbi:MAG: hypothetical protein HGA45_08995 [Chloroflexales bacterium]|nr:hypothetical protein [Chloroflexales bacterium]